MALAAAAIVVPAAAAEHRLAGSPGPAELSTQQVHLRDRLGAADAGLRIDLAPASQRGKEATTNTANGVGPLRIGFHRDVPEAFRGDLLPRLAWVEMGDGAVAAALLVSSPQAKSIRVGLRADLPADGALRFFHPGGEHNALVDPVVAGEELRSLSGQGAGGSAKAPGLFWSPSIHGDTIGIEITLPRAARQSASLRLERIAHRFAGANTAPAP